MFKRDKLHSHPRPNIAVDIVAIATSELARNRDEVVFYFLARILKNEERESRMKNVKDTPLIIDGRQLCTTVRQQQWGSGAKVALRSAMHCSSSAWYGGADTCIQEQLAWTGVGRFWARSIASVHDTLLFFNVITQDICGRPSHWSLSFSQNLFSINVVRQRAQIKTEARKRKTLITASKFHVFIRQFKFCTLYFVASTLLLLIFYPCVDMHRPDPCHSVLPSLNCDVINEWPLAVSNFCYLFKVNRVCVKAAINARLK